MDVEGSAANAAGVTSQGYLIRYRAACQEGERGDAQKPTSPCMPSAFDSRCGRSRASRRTRADVSSPRPRPQAVVTSRPPSAQRARGRGGRWEKPPTRSVPQPHGGNKKRALCARPAERAPHWGAGRRDAPMRRRSRGRREGRPRIAHGQQGPRPRIVRGQQGPGAASAVPRPLWAGTATGGARMDRAPCARDHTHQGRASGPPRRIP